MYNLSTNTYNISLPATNAPSNILLRAYAQNATGYYMGSSIISAGNGELSENLLNITMRKLRNGSIVRTIIGSNVSDRWNQTTIINTTAVLFNLIDEDGVLLSDQNSFIEIKRQFNDDREYLYMLDASNGQFNVSLLENEGFNKLTIYSQQYAPISIPVSSDRQRRQSPRSEGIYAKTVPHYILYIHLKIQAF